MDAWPAIRFEEGEVNWPAVPDYTVTDLPDELAKAGRTSDPLEGDTARARIADVPAQRSLLVRTTITASPSRVQSSEQWKSSRACFARVRSLLPWFSSGISCFCGSYLS